MKSFSVWDFHRETRNDIHDIIRFSVWCDVKAITIDEIFNAVSDTNLDSLFGTLYDDPEI